MLKQLVAFDTTSRNSNLELIRYSQDYLDGYRVRRMRQCDRLAGYGAPSKTSVE